MVDLAIRNVTKKASGMQFSELHFVSLMDVYGMERFSIDMTHDNILSCIKRNSSTKQHEKHGKLTPSASTFLYLLQIRIKQTHEEAHSFTRPWNLFFICRTSIF
jgi:hypothetical protein